jgi:transcriptional regulator with XRE-family HTH domain
MKELGSFLRARREALRPAEVGLADDGVRRTPGLRREEVAMLTGMSAVRYGRLERGSGAELTRELVAGLGRVLRLNTEEYSQLTRLAGVPDTATRDLYIEPGLMAVFDALADVPAYLIDDVTTVVVRNVHAAAVFGTGGGTPSSTTFWPSTSGGRPCNIAWGWFTDPSLPAMIDPRQRDAISQACISQLRAATGWGGDDHPSNRLIADLAESSAHFARLWRTTPMAPFTPIRVTVQHPAAGPLDISIDMVLSPSARHRVVMMRPEPGTATWHQLKTLRSSIEPPQPATLAGSGAPAPANR